MTIAETGKSPEIKMQIVGERVDGLAVEFSSSGSSRKLGTLVGVAGETMEEAVKNAKAFFSRRDVDAWSDVLGEPVSDVIDGVPVVVTNG